jgi:hypothetical protein
VATFVFAPAIAGAWLISSDFHDADNSWRCEPGDRASADAVALGNFARRRLLGKSSPRLVHLVERKDRLAAHLHAFVPRELVAFGARVMIRKRSSIGVRALPA